MFFQVKLSTNAANFGWFRAESIFISFKITLRIHSEQYCTVRHHHKYALLHLNYFVNQDDIPGNNIF